MNVGFELPPEDTQELSRDAMNRLNTFARAGHRIVVKNRLPRTSIYKQLAQLDGVLDIYTRPSTEGYSKQDILNGYRMHSDAIVSAGLWNCWRGHEVSNEPNHQNGPYNGPLGAQAYAGELLAALAEIETIDYVKLLTPGLQLYNHTNEFIAALRSAQALLSGVGAHVYWQYAPEIAQGIVEGVKGAQPDRRLVVTEMGDVSHDADSLRASNIITAIRQLPDTTETVIIFLLCTTNPEFSYFGLDGEQQLRILEAKSMPAGKPEFVLGFRALADQLGAQVVGDPIEPEHYWPDGTISVQTTTKGVLWYSKGGNQAKFLPFV